MEMRIIEKPGCKPMSSKAYPASRKERKILRRIFNQYKSLGIVTDTNSPYANPALLVYKRNKEPRVVVDTRKLNN